MREQRVTMRRRYGAPIAVLLALALGLVAVGCGDDDSSGGSTTAATSTTEDTGSSGGTVAVSMAEWTIEPDADTAAAGEITFDVTNDGSVEHEFVVLKTDIAGADLPLKGDEVDLAKAGEVVGGAHDPDEEAKEEKADPEHQEEEHLAPGASESYMVEADPGSYVLICNIGGHYKAGQWAEFTVE